MGLLSSGPVWVQGTGNRPPSNLREIRKTAMGSRGDAGLTELSGGSKAEHVLPGEHESSTIT